MVKRLLILLSFMVMSLPYQAMGDIFYVDNILGDDALHDGSEASPWQSINFALSTASGVQAGDTIKIIFNQDSPYLEQVTPQIEGTEGMPIIVEGASPWAKAEIWGTEDGQSTDPIRPYAVYNSDKQYITWRNIVGRYTTSSIFHIFALNNTFENCAALESINGFFVALNNTTFKYCLAQNNISYGFNAMFIADTAFYNCLASGNGNSGFYLYRSNGLLEVKNCVAYENEGSYQFYTFQIGTIDASHNFWLGEVDNFWEQNSTHSLNNPVFDFPDPDTTNLPLFSPGEYYYSPIKNSITGYIPKNFNFHYAIREGAFDGVNVGCEKDFHGRTITGPPSIGIHQVGVNIFVDNVNGSDDNDGSSWTNALYTLADEATYYNPYVFQGDNVYVKATNKPYRLLNALNTHSYVSWYFDATGDGLTRNSANKAKVYGSLQIPSGNWSIFYWNNIAFYVADNPFPNHAPYNTEVKGGFLIQADGSIEKITEVGSIPQVQHGQFYINPAQQKLYYRNDDHHPDELNLEWSNGVQFFEGWEGNRLSGAEIRFFDIAYSHGGCPISEISNLDVGYCLNYGVRCAGSEPGGVFKNIVSHHNSGHGFEVTDAPNMNVYNCVSYMNEGDGFYIRGDGGGFYSCSITNCSALANSGVGFNINVDRPGATQYTAQWKITNNLAIFNFGGEFHIVNDEMPIIASNNAWFFNNNPAFEAQKGTDNLEHVWPMLNGYHITANSPCINAGLPEDVVMDIDGELRDASDGAIDIGADEYVGP